MVYTVLLSLLLSVASAAPENDLVNLTALQMTYGINNVKINTTTYSGYLAASETKKLHYLFIQSVNDNTTGTTKDPVLIWFNGGPGCSSLLGAFQENGPITVDADGDRKYLNNPYTWNARANLLYLEQPAGVGFSTGGPASDFNHSDYSQSVDTMAAVADFYAKFPEYSGVDLFVSGESYGGIYVPYLTWQIYQYNMKVDVNNEIHANDSSWTNQTRIPIKGFMVGNGVTNWKYDTEPSLPQTLGGFDMIPNDWLAAFQSKNCNVDRDGKVTGKDVDFCTDIFYNKINKQIPDELNAYDLYRTIPDEEQNWLTDDHQPGLCLAKTHPWLKWRKDAYKILFSTANMTAWLNQNDTKTALNVEDKVWEDCNMTMNQNWLFQEEASQWIYTVLKTSGYIRMMHYSGDTDGVLPTYGTKLWIDDLNWPKNGTYNKWMTDGQVSGFYQKYEGLDFVTVKGVGHMAPQWARKPMQEIINKWMHQEDMFQN